MNWYKPGETSVTPSSDVQFVNDNDRLVVADTVKARPALSMKSNWNPPLGTNFGLANLIVVADQRLRPGKIAMDEGESNPDAKMDAEPLVANFMIVPLAEFAT